MSCNNYLDAVNGQRHKAACLVQEAMNTILPNNEHRLKTAATIIAKNMTAKVIVFNVVIYILSL